MGGVFGVIREERPKFDLVEKTENFEIRQYGPVVVAETTYEGRRGDVRNKNNENAFWALASYIGVLSAPKNIKAGAAAGGEAIAMTAPVITSEQGAGVEKGEKIAMTAPVIMTEQTSAAATAEKGEKIAMTAPVIMTEQTPATETGEKIAMTAPVIMEEKGTGDGATQVTTTMQFVLPSKYTIDTAPKPTDPRVSVREVPGKRVGVFQFNGSWAVAQVDEKALKLKEALETAGHKTKGKYMSAFYNSPYTIPYFRTNEVWYELEN